MTKKPTTATAMLLATLDADEERAIEVMRCEPCAALIRTAGMLERLLKADAASGTPVGQLRDSVLEQVYRLSSAAITATNIARATEARERREASEASKVAATKKKAADEERRARLRQAVADLRQMEAEARAEGLIDDRGQLKEAP